MSNIQTWLEEVRSGKIKKAFPVLSFPCVHLLNVTVRELLFSSDLQAQGMKLVAEKCNSAAAVSMMDLSVEADAFGCPVEIDDEEVPNVTGSIVANMEDIQNLKVPPIEGNRVAIYVEALGKAKKMITDRPVFAGFIGPYSLAGRLRDVSEIMVDCYLDPDAIKLLLQKSTDFLIEYAKAYKAVGADGVFMAEPLAGLLPTELAEEFSEPYVKQIVDAVQDENFLVLYHNCGNNTIRMTESIYRTGCSAYHYGNAIDIKQMLEISPADVIVMGNVDPAGEFCTGTPESIYKTTYDLMEKCCPDHPNFVISSGCDIPPASTWENIASFYRAVEDYYSQH